ncbi:MAG TPA: hypothetical protein VD978_31835 [Azospirillum sp.]|nr:hypothetical protein [Azospirillum sp.]
MTRNTLILVVVVALGCAIALGWAVYQLYMASEYMGVHGWIALGLGTLGVALLTAALMRLLFISSRGGYDQ